MERIEQEREARRQVAALLDARDAGAGDAASAAKAEAAAAHDQEVATAVGPTRRKALETPVATDASGEPVVRRPRSDLLEMHSPPAGATGSGRGGAADGTAVDAAVVLAAEGGGGAARGGAVASRRDAAAATQLQAVARGRTARFNLELERRLEWFHHCLHPAVCGCLGEE